MADSLRAPEGAGSAGAGFYRTGDAGTLRNHGHGGRGLGDSASTASALPTREGAFLKATDRVPGRSVVL